MQLKIRVNGAPDAVKRDKQEWSLLLNIKKAKIMVVDSSRVDIEELMLNEEKIEAVDISVYLCSSKEIRQRLAMAKSTGRVC